MRLTCFGSGSNGNSILVQSSTTNLLIDSGVPVRVLRSGLRHAGVQDGELDAILISHEHHDHIRSATQIERYQPVPFLGTAGTMRALGKRLPVAWQRISATVAVRVGDLEITPIDVSHDAAEPVGFLIANGNCHAAVFTDLGEPNGDVASAISGATIVVLESNYDEVMLSRGPYPAHLKRRIRGPLGHLANNTSAELLARTLDERTSSVWLAHLSEKNNRPQVARAAAEAALQSNAGAPQITTLPRFGETVTWDSEEVLEQHQQSRMF